MKKDVLWCGITTIAIGIAGLAYLNKAMLLRVVNAIPTPPTVSEFTPAQADACKSVATVFRGIAVERDNRKKGVRDNF